MIFVQYRRKKSEEHSDFFTVEIRKERFYANKRT